MVYIECAIPYHINLQGYHHGVYAVEHDVIGPDVDDDSSNEQL